MDRDVKVKESKSDFIRLTKDYEADNGKQFKRGDVVLFDLVTRKKLLKEKIAVPFETLLSPPVEIRKKELKPKNK